MEDVIRNAPSRSLGLACLFVCESILIELGERGLISLHDVRGLLRDASAALSSAADPDGQESKMASEIVEILIERFATSPAQAAFRDFTT